jgi:hypothetical protein
MSYKPKVKTVPEGAHEVWEVYRTPSGVRGTSNFTQREVIFIGPEAEARRIYTEGGHRHHIARRFAVELAGQVYLLATLNPTTYLSAEGKYVRPKLPKVSATPPATRSSSHDSHPVHPEEAATRPV